VDDTKSTRPILRPTGRAVVLDRSGRVLLFRGRSGLDVDGPAGRIWFTPGGGARRGESAAATASRELREETGLVVDPGAMGPVVAETSGIWTATDGRRFLGHDLFFCVRVESLEIDTSGFDDIERGVITGHRWWDAAELERTDETVNPAGLAALARRLYSGERISAPVRLPWKGE
jgi:8-oxo-dGTP pyrophosphatase MutT (NUDIX family)